MFGSFIHVYIPEQLRVDDEIERARIELISVLAAEKTSLRTLFNYLLSDKVEDSLLTPQDIYAFIR
jgi:hypothetical protein